VAEKILFNVAGSENLSMFEVEKISSHISELNPKAKIIFGISKSAKLKNKIKTTILMTGLSDQLAEQVKEEKKQELVKNVKPVEKVAKKVEKQKTASVVKKKNKPFKKSGKKQPKQKQEKKKPIPNIPSNNDDAKKIKPVSIIPVFEVPVPVATIVDQSKINSKTIRRSGLEIKEAEELEEKKRIAQEKEWEIPAFLRRVKYKN
jgi:hypothetical protein